MSRTATTLFAGLAIGALTVILYRRLREVVIEDDPDLIIDRVSAQLQELERRLSAGEQRPLPGV